MDLDISFNGKTMCTPVMDSPELLLLSEGVCRQLGMVTYHSQVVMRKGGRDSDCAGRRKELAQVPAVRVRLVESVRLLPSQSMMATVKLEKGQRLKGPLLLEATDCFAGVGELHFETTLVYPTEDRCAKILLTNSTGYTQKLERGLWVGRASSSPWVSPVILVRKRDDSLQFCIDYQDLNSITKADTFPLP